MTPFRDVSDAFAPFFDKSINIKTKTGLNTTVRCAIMDDATGDDIPDGMMDTD